MLFQNYIYKFMQANSWHYKLFFFHLLFGSGKCVKEGKKLQKLEYLENEKGFLNEIKSIFHSFWRAIIWWKNRKYLGLKLWKTQWLTSGEWGCPIENGPKLAEGQPNCSSKNRLNTFILILNVFKILSLKNKQVKDMVDSNKNKNLIYETNLTDVDFANSALTIIWCPVFDFKFENIQRFRKRCDHRNHIPPFCSLVYHGFSTEKNCGWVSGW